MATKLANHLYHRADHWAEWVAGCLLSLLQHGGLYLSTDVRCRYG
jgi:hypothetical protein